MSRYQFQIMPTPKELLDDTLFFRHGVFQDVAINEVGIYQEGIAITSRASTDLLDAFLADLLGWAAEHLEIRETGIPPRETHYESALIISSEVDLNVAFNRFETIAKALTTYQIGYGLRPFAFDFQGIAIAVDQTLYAGRKPAAFSIARRVNVPHFAGIYYAVAPVKTTDHLALLDRVEKILK
jgi:hypothetical protein